MATFARIVDVDHLTMPEIKALRAGQDVKIDGATYAWHKAFDRALIGAGFDLGEDDNKLRQIFTDRVGDLFVSQYGNNLIIRALLLHNLGMTHDVFPKWETEWDSPYRQQVIDLMHFLQERQGHWLYHYC